MTANIGATLIAPAHPVDLGALGNWLRANVDADIGDIVVEQFQGGQSNPTYRLTAGERRYVLRRKPSGKLLPSAHAVDREFRVMSALAGTDVPVAKMHALCEDDSVIGTAFYVMDYVEGRVLWDPTLPGMTPVQRAAHYDELNRVIAALHRVDYAAIGLGDFGRTGNYIERQVARWTKQYQAAGADRIEAMDRLIEWLPSHIPKSRRNEHRPWRLSPRQRHFPSDRTANTGGARLGVVHTRPSAVRLCLSGDGVASCAAGIPRTEGSRP